MAQLQIDWFIRLAFVRLRTQWRAIVTIITGILLAAVIGASSPLYTSAIAQVGLEQRLSQQPASAVNVHSRLGLRLENGDFAEDRAGYDSAAMDAIRQAVGDFGNWYRETITWAETVTMFVVQDGEDLPGVTMRLAHYDNLSDYATLTAGAWPQEAVESVDAEIALAEPVAEALALTVGDVIAFDQRGWDSSIPITARVSGIFAVDDLSDGYWMTPSPIRIARSGGTLETNAFITRAAFDRLIPEFVPQTRVQIGWRVLFDHGQLAYNRLDKARSAVGGLQNAIRAALEDYSGDRAQIVYETDLAPVLGSYGGEVERLGGPFTLFLLQLGALVLFFLVVMGALVRRNERREIGMLKARGVQNSQLLLLRGVETFIICLIAALVAPFIARQTLIWLTPLFTDVDNIPLEIGTDAFLYAGGAAFVALVVLVATMIPILRSPLVLTAGSAERGQGQAWWQRMYLDVVLLIVGLAALVQLSSTGTLTTGADATQSDPLLLLAPTLLIFALGSVALRLFPAVVNIAARYLGRRGGLAGAMAGWQVSREPLHYGRITFLLALAISIGWFALSFQRTVAASQIDRALYNVGADVRITYTSADPTARLADVIADFDNVAATTEVVRYENVPSSRGTFNLNMAQVIAIRPDAFSAAVRWRDDLGAITPPAVGETIPQTGEPLPFVPDRIGMWGLLRGTFFSTQGFGFDTTQELEIDLFRLRSGDVFVSAVMIDDAGQAFDVRFVAEELADDSFIESVDDDGNTIYELVGDGWFYLQADLSAITGQVNGALHLRALSINAASYNTFGAALLPSSLYLRDLTLIDADDEATSLDWLVTQDWTFTNVRDTVTFPNLTEDDTGTDPDKLADSLTVFWTQGAGSPRFNMNLNYPIVYTVGDAPVTMLGGGSNSVTATDDEIIGIPAIISRSMADEQNITIGQNFEMLFNQRSVWFEAAQINDYFPTLYGDQSPFVAVDFAAMDHVLTYLNGGVQRDDPRELWVRLIDENAIEAFMIDLELQDDGAFNIQAVTRADTVANTIQTDLLAVGLIGLLIFSAIVGLLLSFVSLLTYAGLAVQARQTEFAVLRALGFGTRRIIFSMAVEQTFVIATSTALGVLIGILLSTQVLPVLSIDTGGGRLTPPFNVQIEPLVLLAYVGGILSLLALQLVFSSLLVGRLTTAQALRQPGE